MMRYVSFLALIFYLTGCGYHVQEQAGVLPADIEKVYIRLFTNMTAEPQLDSLLTGRVSEVFSRNSKIVQVERLECAEATLEGTIHDYTNRALSYDSNDSIGEYRATMTVSVVLRQPEAEKPLWKGTVRWSEAYRSDSDKNDQVELEQLAIDEITLRLAEELHDRLLNDF